jgi:hypothetical protein
MTRDKFNFLPDYVNKQSKISRSEKRVQVVTSGVIGEIIKTEYQKSESWFLYFNNKYDLEQDGLFWSKSEFILEVIFPVNVPFISLNMRIGLASVENNKLVVTSQDQILFETSYMDGHVDIEIPYASSYKFKSKPMIPNNDNRELGLYISEISIIDLDLKKNIIPYNHLMQFRLSDITPISVCQN